MALRMRIYYKQDSMASKRPGRPAYLTELAKKRLRRERSRAKSVTRIYLGDQYVRWMAKKRELDETHEGLAKILLDRFVDRNILLFFLNSPR